MKLVRCPHGNPSGCAKCAKVADDMRELADVARAGMERAVAELHSECVAFSDVLPLLREARQARFGGALVDLDRAQHNLLAKLTPEQHAEALK